MTEQSPFTATPFTPADDDVRSLLDWFDRYDGHARRHDIEAMADMALFPLVVMTNDSAGECVVQEWDRATFVQAMDTGTSSADIANRREPAFLGADLAAVVTDATVTEDGRVQHMRYVDVMAKEGGDWRFKSMIQSGWGDMLKAYAGG